MGASVLTNPNGKLHNQLLRLILFLYKLKVLLLFQSCLLEIPVFFWRLQIYIASELLPFQLSIKTTLSAEVLKTFFFPLNEFSEPNKAIADLNLLLF